MRRLIIWYPLLFSINVFLTIYVSQINVIPLQEIILPISIAVIISAGIWVLLVRLFKDVQRASFITFLIILWFSYFGAVQSAVFSQLRITSNIWINGGFLFLWTVLFGILGSNNIWKKITKPEMITAYMAVVGLCVMIMSIYRYGQFKLAGYDRILSSEFPQPTLHFSQRPDIYYIILDGYSRSDVLEKVYNFSNGEFLEFLKQRGFYIATQSRSNYIQTILSLSSSLNMDYLPNIKSGRSQDSKYLENWISNNVVIRALKEIGYRPIVLPSGYRFTEIVEHIPESLTSYYHPHKGSLELLFIWYSVLNFGQVNGLALTPTDQYADQQARIITNGSTIGEIAGEPGPKFVFWHILAPHPPFIFDESGPINPNALYFPFDGTGSHVTSEVYIDGYLKQISYVNHLLTDVIDDILQNSEVPPIIVLQGDHGGGAYLDLSSQDDTCLYERYSILNAYLLPGFEGNEVVYSSITPLNSFRMIFNLYFGTHLSYLDDDSYYSDFMHLYNFINITNSIGNDCAEFQK
jgi:hypothetical protein